MRITIPDFCLVALIGWSGPARNALAHGLFQPAEICDLETGTDAALQAAGQRLARRELAVVEAATGSRAELTALAHLAKTWHAPRVAVVADRALAGRLDRAGFHAIHAIDDPAAVEMLREPLPVDRRAEQRLLRTRH